MFHIFLKKYFQVPNENISTLKKKDKLCFSYFIIKLHTHIISLFHAHTHKHMLNAQSLSPTCTHPLFHTLTHTYTHTYSLSLSYKHIHKLTYALPVTSKHPITITAPQLLSLTHTLAHTFSLSHTHSLSHKTHTALSHT